VAAFGPFRFFPTARRLERDGVPVELGGRAIDVLIALVRHAGRVLSRAELMSTIWSDATVVEGVLRTQVYNLRRALGDGVGGVRYITSVAGRSYCFVAPVIRGASGATTPTARTSGRSRTVCLPASCGWRAATRWSGSSPRSSWSSASSPSSAPPASARRRSRRRSDARCSTTSEARCVSSS
jgi:DNA-binding winged helix-turn-helix (wHTH) protein